MIIKEIKNPKNQIVQKIYYNENNDVSIAIDNINKTFCISQDGNPTFVEKDVIKILSNEFNYINYNKILKLLDYLWEIYSFNKPSNEFEECFDEIVETIHTLFE